MPKSFSLSTCALLSFSILSFCLFSQARCFYRFPRDCNPTPITENDICNFHKVDADLYRGSTPRCSGYIKLSQIGVRTIIYLQGVNEKSADRCAKAGVHLHFHFIAFYIGPLQTAFTGVTDENMRRLFAEIRKAPKPVFVNCRLGKDRTGAVVAIYRMKRQEMSFEEAWREALHYRFGSRFFGLKKTLDRYKDPAALAALPAPALVPPPPESVCRPALRALDHGFGEDPELRAACK